MENEKLFGFIRRRGTLGILTLVLVGIVAFASYRTSYPVTTETEQTEEVKEASGTRQCVRRCYGRYTGRSGSSWQR